MKFLSALIALTLVENSSAGLAGITAATAAKFSYDTAASEYHMLFGAVGVSTNVATDTTTITFAPAAADSILTGPNTMAVGDITIKRVYMKCYTAANYKNSVLNVDKLVVPADATEGFTWVVATDNTTLVASTVAAYTAGRFKFVGTTGVLTLQGTFGMGATLKSCVYDVAFTLGNSQGLKPVFPNNSITVQRLGDDTKSPAIVAGTKSTLCIGAVAKQASIPLVKGDCQPTPKFTVSGQAKQYELGAFSMTPVANMTGASVPGSQTDCTNSAALSYKNCYAGYGVTSTYQVSIAVSQAIFKVAHVETSIGGNSQFDCSTNKACLLKNSGASGTTAYVAKSVDSAKSYTDLGINILFVNVYSSNLGGTATAVSDVTKASLSFNLPYASYETTAYFKTVTDQLTALQTSVAALDTKVSGLNGSETIIPLFFLGVFGSLFALTM